jgi:hypothetical protein
MNREQIIRMAREAGFNPVSYTGANLELFERFAALVAAAEREACALIAKDWDASHPHTNYGACISNAIRSRSEQCG